jgi:hypothetical protein
LKEPPDQPEYRARRGHEAFMRNVSASRAELVRAVSGLFQAKPESGATEFEIGQARALAREKYGNRDWVWRR